MHDTLMPSEADSDRSRITSEEALPPPAISVASVPPSGTDLTRSNSYILSRGGKFISSRPWSCQDPQMPSHAMKIILPLSTKDNKERSSPPSSESSDSSSDDEGDAEEGRLSLDALGNLRKISTAFPYGEEEQHSSSSGDTDETESTVVARLPAPPDHIDEEEDSAFQDKNSHRKECDEYDDFNDTLSSVSGGDFSFESDHSPVIKDRSQSKSPFAVDDIPPKEIPSMDLSGIILRIDDEEDEEERPPTEPHTPEGESQLSRSFEFYPNLPRAIHDQQKNDVLDPEMDTLGDELKIQLDQLRERALDLLDSRVDPYGSAKSSFGMPRPEYVKTVKPNHIVKGDSDICVRASKNSIEPPSNSPGGIFCLSGYPVTSSLYGGIPHTSSLPRLKCSTSTNTPSDKVSSDKKFMTVSKEKLTKLYEIPSLQSPTLVAQSRGGREGSPKSRKITPISPPTGHRRSQEKMSNGERLSSNILPNGTLHAIDAHITSALLNDGADPASKNPSRPGARDSPSFSTSTLTKKDLRSPSATSNDPSASTPNPSPGRNAPNHRQQLTDYLLSQNGHHHQHQRGSLRREDSEELSDVSSGATSEDSSSTYPYKTPPPAGGGGGRKTPTKKGDYSTVSSRENSTHGSPMLTSLIEDRVTRLATPPDFRQISSYSSSDVCPAENMGVSSLHRHYRHRNHPRPPPAPRPKTLEGSELIPRAARGVYSPSREPTPYSRSREASLERGMRDPSSCDRNLPSKGIHHSIRSHHHGHPHTNYSFYPDCCYEDDLDYDSCDERHHHHRHSYHEGLQHAHLYHTPHSHAHNHSHAPLFNRDSSREGQFMGRIPPGGRRSASPCVCCPVYPSTPASAVGLVGSMSALNENCGMGNPLAMAPLSYRDKVGGESGTSMVPHHAPIRGGPDEDYITLWSCHSPLGLEERISRLESDKESLQLQVSVLDEQVEAQAEKMLELEATLDQKKKHLSYAEDHLQKEIMVRSSLETQHLELLSEISNLKLCQAAYEREILDLKDKLHLSEMNHTHMQCPPPVGHSFSPAAASTPLHSFTNAEASDSESKHGGAPLPIMASPSPTSASTLSVIPHSPNSPPNARKSGSPEEAQITTASAIANKDSGLPPRTPPSNARRKIEQFGTMPRYQKELTSILGSSAGSSTPPLGSGTMGRPTKGVVFGKGFNTFLSFRITGKRSTSAPNLAETERQPNDMEGTSTPVLPLKSESARGTASVSPASMPHRSPSIGHKPSGIKKIFTKLRRSSSGHIENDVGEVDLKRGGVRSTASARLGWTAANLSFKEPHLPFSSWSVETVESWLSHLGLSQYCAATRCWMDAGNHISKANPHQLERDLGLRHPLHRKKLQLAISNRTSTGVYHNRACSLLDGAWVLRWLDDVGLPQYKDTFGEARIDGMVLNCLTYDDLNFLKIANLLHISSLKRGVQVLRERMFDPTVLKRRAAPEEEKKNITASDVAVWTNHRVMEWLKTVDLSEYAPNLRGSGVHGALLIYEVRFTPDLLASILSISSSKTLLRRHLNTHFNELIGKEVVHLKREVSVSPGFVPLTTSAKMKMPRKSQFSLKRRKTKTELEFDDLLCPLDEILPRILQRDVNKERLQRSSAPPSALGRTTKA